MKMRRLALAALALGTAALFTTLKADAAAPSIDQPLSEDDRVLVVTRARVEMNRVSRYSGQWVPVSGYPMGDIPSDRGACTDLVVRALRIVGIDLQQLVHEDILAARDAYGVDRADAQVDHRRVAVLYTYFKRHLAQHSIDPYNDTESFQPGDLVFFGEKGRPRHVALVSNRMGPRFIPLVIENGGPKPQESDTLDSATRPLMAHFRIGAAKKRR